jgi:hypothetical protein
MRLQSTGQIEANIVELCSEDDYGSWELWWNTSADVPTNRIPDVKMQFLDVVSNLVSDGKLIAKRHGEDGNIVPTQFDHGKLAREVDFAGDPDPGSFFWFGTD